MVSSENPISIIGNGLLFLFVTVLLAIVASALLQAFAQRIWAYLTQHYLKWRSWQRSKSLFGIRLVLLYKLGQRKECVPSNTLLSPDARVFGLCIRQKTLPSWLCVTAFNDRSCEYKLRNYQTCKGNWIFEIVFPYRGESRRVKTVTFAFSDRNTQEVYCTYAWRRQTRQHHDSHAAFNLPQAIRERAGIFERLGPW